MCVLNVPQSLSNVVTTGLTMAPDRLERLERLELPAKLTIRYHNQAYVDSPKKAGKALERWKGCLSVQQEPALPARSHSGLLSTGKASFR